MNTNELRIAVKGGKIDATLTELYGAENIKAQEARYINVVNEFAKLFGGDREISLFSVAGRSEISGNHTDHNYGKVLAASINLDIIAVAAKNGENTIRIKSEGFPEDVIDITDTAQVVGTPSLDDIALQTMQAEQPQPKAEPVTEEVKAEPVTPTETEQGELPKSSLWDDDRIAEIARNRKTTKTEEQ